MRLRQGIWLWLALILSLMSGGSVHAVIQVLIPLRALIDDSDLILLAKVERIDPSRPAAVFAVTRALKGASTLDRISVNLTGDKEKHTPHLLKRLAPELPLILCVKKQDKDKSMILAFSNGTWFQVLGQSDGRQTRWAFTHCETYLRRTFKGRTAELEQIITDALAGTKKPPPPNPQEPPGLGPEI
jgi:hypothetical protein